MKTCNTKTSKKNAKKSRNKSSVKNDANKNGTGANMQNQQNIMPNVGYLQHGQQPGPFRTEAVQLKHEYADRWLAWFDGKWRRVYIQVSRTYIVYRGEKIKILIEGV